MIWFYSQKTGIIRHGDELVACGYAGRGLCKNVPAAQIVHGEGPLPRGLYEMDTPGDHPGVGKYAIPLKPSMDNQMFGRSGFYIHGDSAGHPGQASEGCIVTDLGTRVQIWSSGDHELEVTE